MLPQVGNNQMIKVLLWLILFMLCWPLAILGAVVAADRVATASPLRLLGIAVSGVFELFRAISSCRRACLAAGQGDEAE